MNRAFVEAARDGNIDEVCRLLDAGVSPDAGHDSGYTALGLVVNRGHSDVAALLLRRKASYRRVIFTKSLEYIIGTS